MALGVFKRSYRLSNMPESAHEVVFQLVDSKWSSLEDRLLFGREKELLTGVEWDLESVPRVVAALSRLVSLFGHDDHGQHLKLAGRWLFDSYANDGGAMQYMQLAVATEVMLGLAESDESITQTLSNRCAYLIARGAKEREDIKREFVALYKLRSKIVHNGRDRLSPDEHGMLRRFRILCARVVDAELDLALADVQEQQ